MNERMSENRVPSDLASWAVRRASTQAVDGAIADNQFASTPSASTPSASTPSALPAGVVPPFDDGPAQLWRPDRRHPGARVFSVQRVATEASGSEERWPWLARRRFILNLKPGFGALL